jgi:hypothetical protein
VKLIFCAKKKRRRWKKRPVVIIPRLNESGKIKNKRTYEIKELKIEPLRDRTGGFDVTPHDSITLTPSMVRVNLSVT